VCIRCVNEKPDESVIRSSPASRTIGTKEGSSVSRRGWILFAALAVIWGIPYLLIKVADEAFSPASLVFFRTAIGAVVMVPVAVKRDELRPLVGRWRIVLLYTVVELGVPWVLLAWAERKLASSLAGLLVAAVPLVGTVLQRMAGVRNHIGRDGLIGLAAGLAGVAVLVGFDIHGADAASFAAMAAVVVGYALGPFIVSRKLADVPGNGVVAASLALTAIVYAPFGIAELPVTMPSARAIASIVALGVVCTALAFVLFFGLIAEAGPVRATVITYVNPAVAVLLGVALLGEPFTVATGVGFILVLGGSVLATNGGRRPRGGPTYTGTSDSADPEAPGAGSDGQAGGSVIVDPGVVDRSSQRARGEPRGGAG
jgi:drug/metabolite transporter (DMT)-like permease